MHSIFVAILFAIRIYSNSVHCQPNQRIWLRKIPSEFYNIEVDGTIQSSAVLPVRAILTLTFILYLTNAFSTAPRKYVSISITCN